MRSKKFLRLVLTLSVVTAVVILGLYREDLKNLQGRFRVPQLTTQADCSAGTFDSPAFDVLVDANPRHAAADFHSLTNAMHSSPSGTRIVLCPGTYETYAFLENKTLSVFGVGPNASDVIIVPDLRVARAQFAENGSLTVVSGSTLNLFHLTLKGAPSQGSIISVASTLNLADVWFQKNSRALAVLGASTLNLQDGHFVDNFEDISWGQASILDISNTEFEGSQTRPSVAITAAQGLTVEYPQRVLTDYFSGDYAGLSIRNSSFKGYTASVGVIDFYAGGNGLQNMGIKLSNVDILDNGDLGTTSFIASLSGGGTVELKNVQFKQNASRYLGMVVAGNRVVIENSEFLNNTMDSQEVLTIQTGSGQLSGSEIAGNHIFHPFTVPTIIDFQIGAINFKGGNVSLKNNTISGNLPQNCSSRSDAVLTNLGGNTDDDGSCGL